METNRGGRQGARHGLLAAFRQYIADLDARSRANLHQHAELREATNAEREQRESELRTEAEIFVSRLPRWLRCRMAEHLAAEAGGAEPGWVALGRTESGGVETGTMAPHAAISGPPWVAAVDLVLQRRRGRPPFVAHAGRAWIGMTLAQGTTLRLVTRGMAPPAVPLGTSPSGGPEQVMDLSPEDRPTPSEDGTRRTRYQPSATCATRTFEVLDGPLAGQMIEVAADPAGGFRRQALTAAAMVAPGGERIAEVPAAAHSVLAQLEACQRQADHADAVLRHWRNWAWAHAPGAPREAEVRLDAVDRPTVRHDRSTHR